MSIIFKKIIFGSLFSSILFFSCEKSLLDTTPESSLSSSTIFSTAKRIDGLVNGAYDALKSASLYGGRYLLYLDVRGEDFINVTGNVYTAYESWTNSYTSGSNDVNNLWTAAYSTINDANIILNGLGSLSEGIISDSLKLQYIGEAKFLRALSYYSLVSIYAEPYNKDQGASAGLPLRLEAEVNSDNNNLARSTVKEVYTQILSDLDSAELLLPNKYSTDLLNTTHAHKSTAIALKTRVYLNQNDFDNTIKEAQKLVPQTSAPFSTTFGVLHALQSDITNIFSSNYTTTESIFSTPSTTSDSYSGQSAIGYIYYVNKEYYLNPSGILNTSIWSSTDNRRNLLSLSGSQYLLKKYSKSSPYVDYIPVIRFSEVLLNYAEAEAQLGNLSLALNLLNAVHQRSDANYQFANSLVSTKDSLIATIWKERRIELLGEGFRSNDLLRNLLTIPAKGSSSLQASSVAPTDENYIFPLPNNEISTNKDL
ncbi:RagB/SusD family nutrient uptake outer membrane protein [Rhizosphaericola mali]|uniref:RagB/SusD family nutrient uptake outer membrane protein n=1 Tax=Rhizosphaericola mali TaxID=2545455 RepID=A0A5P2G0W4_9BACT|nr:RagB/SusD family nutrient uptake outer membrane protein [Rhizosphaericola mali]QES88298.1 RagB/SusD family nutrient uptake outer membrane protein [Rhizosphaericola mali]